MQPQIWYTLPMIPRSAILCLRSYMTEISLRRNLSLFSSLYWSQKRLLQMFLLFSSSIKVTQLRTDIILHSIICDNQNDQCSLRRSALFTHFMKHATLITSSHITWAFNCIHAVEFEESRGMRQRSFITFNLVPTPSFHKALNPCLSHSSCIHTRYISIFRSTLSRKPLRLFMLDFV